VSTTSGTDALVAPRTVTVEVWSDIACPWCFIGKRRFAHALATFPHREHVDVVWRSYQLSPDTPRGPGRPEAQALAEMKGLPLDRVQQMFAHVTSVAAGDGLAYDFDTVLAFNSYDAHRLVHLARETGGPELAERAL
jgi:predicted DsbA family dithiol-disulfide isomerase